MLSLSRWFSRKITRFKPLPIGACSDIKTQSAANDNPTAHEAIGSCASESLRVRCASEEGGGGEQRQTHVDGGLDLDVIGWGWVGSF